jgi:hypothetical protein
MPDLAASLPPPTPLRRGLLIHYQWGEQKFEIAATAASIRTAFWEEAGRDVTWLHCKATQTTAIQQDGSCSLINVLIPAEYVTRAEAGPTFRISQSKPSGDLGIFPPNQSPPADAMPLEELERVIAGLVDTSLN